MTPTKKQYDKAERLLKYTNIARGCVQSSDIGSVCIEFKDGARVGIYNIELVTK